MAEKLTYCFVPSGSTGFIQGSWYISLEAAIQDARSQNLAGEIFSAEQVATYAQQLATQSRLLDRLYEQLRELVKSRGDLAKKLQKFNWYLAAEPWKQVSACSKNLLDKIERYKKQEVNVTHKDALLLLELVEGLLDNPEEREARIRSEGACIEHDYNAVCKSISDLEMEIHHVKQQVVLLPQPLYVVKLVQPADMQGEGRVKMIIPPFEE